MKDLVTTVGEAALKGLLDRKGIGDELELVREDDDIWEDIVAETGKAAVDATAEYGCRLPTASQREEAETHLRMHCVHEIAECYRTAGWKTSAEAIVAEAKTLFAWVKTGA
jgi:hypothetical protein